MEKTPGALRKHVILLGSTNAGKSTLFNALTGQDRSIVSPRPGTTTDTVQAAMELHPFGPIVLVDTAGLGDDSDLGPLRMKKTAIARRKADAALYVADATAFNAAEYAAFQGEQLPHLLVLTKCALAESLSPLQAAYPAAVFLTGETWEIPALREKLSELLSRQQPDDDTLLGDLLPGGSHVVMVIPVDSEAPKGRLILPQVQLLRDCLDHGIKCTVCRETELESALDSLNRVDLVVTDSQAFAYVSQRVPDTMPLTSFSMLLARQKGSFSQLLAGARAIPALLDGDRVLMLEGCTHNHNHEDIGRVKLPRLLQAKTGKKLEFDFCSGYDFPDDLSPYRLAIQCGSCMLNKREITSRLAEMERLGLPVSNYGIVLAWGTGILARCCEIFTREDRA